MKKMQLSETILFAGMKDEETDRCLSVLRAQKKKYPKGAVILSAGSKTERMGLVLSGSVTIESNDLWGNRTVLSHVPEGQFFAETYALLGEVMLVDVRANEDCEILFLNLSGIFDSQAEDNVMNRLAARLLRISASKNLTLSSRSFHTAPKSARARILAWLNTVSLQKQSADFEIPFDRQQMADYLNLERTNMSKELSKMQKEGLIRFKKNHFLLITDGQS